MAGNGGSVAEGFDSPELVFEQFGTVNWQFSEDADAWNGNAVVGTLPTDEAMADLRTTVEGPAVVSFSHKVGEESEEWVAGPFLEFSTKDLATGEWSEHLEAASDWWYQDWRYTTVHLGAGRHELRWLVWAPFGLDFAPATAWLDNLTIERRGGPLSDGVDLPDQQLWSAGHAPWQFTPLDDAHNGNAVTAVLLNDETEANLFTQINGPAVVSFAYKKAERDSNLYLTLYLDGRWQFTAYYNRSGWDQYSIRLGPGLHQLQWGLWAALRESTGTAQAWLDKLTIVADGEGTPLPNMGEAIEAPETSWRSLGPVHWVIDDTFHLSGTSSIKSGPINPYGSSWIQSSIAGPAMINFWWRCSTAVGEQHLALMVDGVELDRIQGKLEWSERKFFLPEGEHQVTFVSRSQGTFMGGFGAGWVDRFSVNRTDNAGSPFINHQPQHTIVQEGGPIQLDVSATGNGVLAYQWFRNNVPIEGANDQRLSIATASYANQGAYFVTVSNMVGVVESKTVRVEVRQERDPLRLAWYSFAGHFLDELGISNPGEVDAVVFMEGGIYLNGVYEYQRPGEGFRTVFHVPDLDFEAFAVALDFKPKDTSGTVLVGGEVYRWFSLRMNNGKLELTLNNQDFVYAFADAPILLEEWNSIVSSVDIQGGTIRTWLNGAALEDVVLPTDFVLDVLQDDSHSQSIAKHFTFANYSNGEAYHGLADNLIVYRRALGLEDVPSKLPVPDLWVKSIDAPTSASPGEWVDVQVEVGNAANFTGASLWRDRIFLSSDEILDANDLPLVQLNREIGLQANGEYTLLFRFPMPEVVGNWNFIVELDSSNVLAEGLESNNRRVWPIRVFPGDCRLPPTGLVGWWPGDGHVDSVQGFFHGRKQGGVGFVEGKAQEAMAFDGVDDFVEFPGLNFGVVPGISFWLATEKTDQCILDGGPASRAWRVGISPDGRMEYLHYANGQDVYHKALGIRMVADGQYHHVVATTDQASRTIKVFVDGELDATMEAPEAGFGAWAASATGDVNLGRCRTAELPGPLHFSGAIDELMVFGHPLSSEEVVDLYQGGDLGYCSASILESPRAPGSIRILTLDESRVSRCGVMNFNFATGQNLANLRATLLNTANFGPSGVVPKSVELLPPVPVLNPLTLTNADVVVLITAPVLTAEEVAALQDFVASGRGLVIAGNEAAVRVGPMFGAPVGGYTSSASATVSRDDITPTTGPFGKVGAGTRLTTGYAGSFPSGGLGFRGTGFMNNNVGVFGATFELGNGRAVVFTDEEIFLNGPSTSSCGATYLNPTSQTLFLNAIAHAADRRDIPQIVLEPGDVDVLETRDTELKLGVKGREPFRYQWFHEGAALIGETGSRLNLPEIRMDQAGAYSVVISNLHGSVTSRLASVTVRADLVGPKVVGVEPVGRDRQTVTALRWRFNERVRASSLGKDDLQLEGSAGVVDLGEAILSELPPADGTHFELGLGSALPDGVYELSIGPSIEDYAGNAMDAVQAMATYMTDFESGVGPEWSSSRLLTNDTRYLGRYGNESVTLTLSSLPSHSKVRLDLDVFLLNTWDGDGRHCCGPDVWGFRVDGRSTAEFEETFDVSRFPARPVRGLTHEFLHSSGSLSLTFYGRNLQELADEAWAIDNVKVQYLADTQGRYVGRFSVDGTGPKVVAMSPVGIVNEPVRSFELEFDSEIPPLFFTAQDASVNGSGGVAVTNIERIAGKRFRVHMSAPLGEGVHIVRVGPDILDLAGNRMDQDNDGIQGEEMEDAFSAELAVRLPDLAVEAVEIPGSVVAGQSLRISWVTRNLGQGAANRPWQARVSLAEDGSGGSAVERALVSSVSELKAGGSLVQAAEFFIPADWYGPRFVMIELDSTAQVAEANEGNNRFVATTAITVILPPPRIVTEPQGRQVVVGGQALFGVTAVGGPPLKYQWLRNGVPLMGATSPSLFLSNVGKGEAGEYSVIVTNAASAVESAKAPLVVERLLRVSNRSVAEGTVFDLPIDILALGDERFLGFSLHFDVARLSFVEAFRGGSVADVPLVVETSQTAAGRLGLSLTMPGGSALGDRTQQVAVIRFRAATGAGLASLRFEDVPVPRKVVDLLGDESTVKVQEGQVLIAELPVILSQPQPQTVEVGKSVVFSVGARGTGSVRYQWYFGDSPISGATRQTLTLAALRLDQSGQYSVVVSDAVGTVTSTPATLTVAQDLTSPLIVEFDPTGRRNTSVTNIQFRFNEAVAVETLTREDVRITTPGGVLPADQVEIRQISEVLFQALFPEQTVDGEYAVQVGPAISDLFGNTMASAGYRATFTLDRTGPSLTNLRYRTVPVASGTFVRETGVVSIEAADVSGVNRVEFSAGNQAIGTDSDAAGGFSVAWNLDLTPDGPTTLQARGFDSLGNSASVAIPVIVAMSPPAAPVIVSPANGATVNDILIMVRGTTARNTTVVFYRNGSEVGSRIPVTVSGTFEAPVPLVDGSNAIQVAALNRGGEGAKSPIVNVSVDRSVPNPPSGLQARSRDGGRVFLDWGNAQPDGVRGYQVYRASTPFTNQTQAIRVTPAPITELRFTDQPPSDGTYYYRVGTVNLAGTEGPLSSMVEAIADATPPQALEVKYFPEGNHEPSTGVYGTGAIRVELTLSETLLAAPFFSVTPSSGIPIVVDLNPISGGSANRYGGRMVIATQTPSGPADVVMSARDTVGNRGTVIVEGATVLLLDTSGPEVVGLEIAPTETIRNDAASPVTVSFTARLDGAVRDGTTPEFRYRLTTSQPEAVPVSSVQPGPDSTTWLIQIALAASAGAVTENLELEFRAEDALGNVGTRILPIHRFQVYQGDLPAFESPVGLVAKALPAGRVRLTWQPVPKAADYAVFRKSATAAEFSFVTRTDGGTEAIDLPDIDGTYQYVIATVRRENGQESVGLPSFVVAAVSDRVAPGAPRNLTLRLASNGVFALWQVPAATIETITYGLARAATGPITTAEGVVAYRARIPATQIVDPSPAPNQGFYAVYAEDAAGNRSLPSNTEYLNVQLLPVRTLTAERTDDASPIIRWTQASPSATGYDFYLGPDSELFRLNTQGPLTQTSFTDLGYDGRDRRYTVVTLDATGHESLGRSLSLPAVEWELAPESVVRRGLMNRLVFTVQSQSASPLSNARLKLSLGGRDHFSETFTLEPGASQEVGVVVGGYADLPDASAEFRLTLENRPNEGERVALSRRGSVPVGDGQVLVGVQGRDLTRGGSGTVQFSLLNPGDVEIEVITSRGGGASPDIRFNLIDVDGNILGSSAFQARSGATIVNLSNGDSVMRLSPGAEGLSPSFTIPIPENVPNRIFVQVQIDRVRYHSDQPDRVEMQGLQSRAEMAVIDTTYTGAVTSVVPSESTGEQVVQIFGGAILRGSGQPAPNVPLLVKIANGGFERTDAVTTDSTGAFVTTFQPLPGESGGVYSVWAVHPELRDRTVQKTFTIRRVVVSPSQFTVRAPFNFAQPLNLRANAGPGTTAVNLRIVARPEDQPNGTFPSGVEIDSGPVIARLEPGKSANLAPVITAGEGSAQRSRVILAVVSDDNPNPWQKLTANLEFAQSTPALRWGPSVVETGVAPESSVSAQVNLENAGLVGARDLKFAITRNDGSPAPAWVTLGTAPTLAELPVGGRFEIGLNFQPGKSVAEDDYAFTLQITSANHPQVNVGIYVAVANSGKGNLLFRVVDMFTGTDADGNLQGGLGGATIRVQNEQVESIELRLTSDGNGEALFEALPAGRYRYQVTADKHNGANGRIWVRPKITTTEQVALGYSLVTVEWEVVPITIEDRYEIVLEAVFETDVPAPVVVIEPSVVNLPQLFAGDVFYGEFSIQNHGLIRADAFTFELPPSDDYLEYELLAGLPDQLNAKQRLRVPYRIVCKKSLPGPRPEPTTSPALAAGRRDAEQRMVRLASTRESRSSETGSKALGLHGGSGSADCFTYNSASKCRYVYRCDNGLTFPGGAGTGWYYSYKPGCAGGGSGSGGSTTFGAWSSPSSSSNPKGATVEWVTDMCVPTLECGASSQCDTQCCEGRHPGNSWVDLMSREYRDEITDMKVKIPGGEASVTRHFFRNAWQWADTARSLEFIQGAEGILKIRRWLIDYRPINTSRTAFAYREIRITREVDGWRWENKDGDWEFYSPEGRILATGKRNLVLTQFVYGEGGRLEAVTERNDRTVFTYLYDGERLAGVRDLSGREVKYGHTSGRLTRVVDAVGNEMTYAYDGAGRMTSKKDINGLEVFVTYRAGSQVASVLDNQGNGDHFQFYYDKNNRQFYSSVRTTGGQTEEKWFNSEGRLIDQIRSGIQGDKVQFDGRNEIITKNTGVVWKRDYDEWGNLTREVRPDGGIVRAEYHPLFHLPTREIDPRGAVTLRRYDDNGNLIERIDASGTEIARTNRWEYDASNRMVRRIDARGNKMDFTYDENDNLIREFDPDNTPYQTFYGYDARGNRTSTTNALGYVTQYGYDGLNRLVAETNALGHVNLYTYTGNNLTQLETGKDGDNRGRIVRYVYDDQGRRTHTYRVDENNVDHIWETVTYDSDGHQIAVANALGQTTRYEYNTAGQQTKVLRPFSATETSDIEYVYDEFGRMDREIDPLGVVTRYEYDALDRNRKVTEAVGTPVERSRERGYDFTGNLTSITYSDGTNALKTLYSYDFLSRRTQIRGAREYPKDFEYDGNDNLVAEINGRGYRSEFRHDQYNRKTNTVEGIRHPEPGEHAGSTDYDLLGRVVTTYDGNGNHRHYHHDPESRVLAESIPLAPTSSSASGSWWTDDAIVLQRMFYNPWGQPVGTSNVVGGVTATRYDLFGRRIQHTDAAGLTLTNHYNAADQLVEVHYPVVSTAPGGSLSTFYRYDYDAFNSQLLRAVTDRSGLITRYEYDRRLLRIGELTSWNGITIFRLDALGRQTGVTNALGEIREEVFDQFDQVIATIRPNPSPPDAQLIGHYEYDHYGQLIQKSGDGWLHERHVRDAVGNIIKAFDGNGNVTSWDFDGRNRPVRKTYADGLLSESRFDASGNQTVRQDGKRKVSAARFDEYNNVTKIEYSSGKVVSILRDKLGRMTDILDANERLSIEYDSAGNITNETDFARGTRVNRQFDRERNMVRLQIGHPTFSADSVQELSYDGAGRYSKLLMRSPQVFEYAIEYEDVANVIRSILYPSGTILKFEYDPLMRRTSAVVEQEGGGSTTIAERRFGIGDWPTELRLGNVKYEVQYDRVGQTTRISQRMPDGENRDFAFDYDRAGNLRRMDTPRGTRTFEANALNQITQSVGATRQSLTYDDNGNLISSGMRMYEYDEEDFLIKAEEEDFAAKFSYDGLGRRVALEVFHTGMRPQKLEFLLDNTQPVAAVLADGTGRTEIVRGPDARLSRDEMGGIGGVLGIVREGRSRDTISDFSGNTASLEEVLDGTSSVYDLGPTGNEEERPIEPELDFSSMYRVPIAGLSLFAARVYDAGLGRWLTRDRVEEAGGQNLYRYAGNAFKVRVDPFGEIEGEDLWGSGGYRGQPPGSHGPSRGNCWRYACRKPTPPGATEGEHFLSPPGWPGFACGPSATSSAGCAALMNGLKNSGTGVSPGPGSACGSKCSSGCPCGYHRITVQYKPVCFPYTDPVTGVTGTRCCTGDFHFSTEFADCTWGHKPGSTAPGPVSGPGYSSPGYVLCGVLCVKD